ncbi:RICIN domain-containing protein [Streptomyces albofaciens]|uniref:RICIN domain-containing protein n=1 Tax=Streptomyces albofaciens TaxID=66866 RepID=UPI00142EFA3B|nr:RICIN domain-containing protein [Streptomyces albofaciens]
MSRSIRAALAVAGSIAALAGGVTTAHADQAAPRAAAPAAGTVVQLKVAHSGKCLDLDHGKKDNGAEVRQYTCNATVDQKWRAVPVEDSAFELRAVASNKCLEVENSGKQAGARVQQWACSGSPNMRWRFFLVDPVKHLYQLRPLHVENEKRCLDIKGAAKGDGAKAQQWYCNQTEAQLWQFLPVA